MAVDACRRAPSIRCAWDERRAANIWTCPRFYHLSIAYSNEMATRARLLARTLRIAATVRSSAAASGLRRPVSAGIAVASAVVLGASTVICAADPKASAKDVAAKAQTMYGGNPRLIYDLIIQHIANGGEASADVLWRLARACHDLAGESSDKTAKKSLTLEAYAAMQEALKKDPNSSPVHKWMAIIISDIGDFEGTTKKLQDSYLIRDHFVRAIELDPKDATARHLLGLWCFTFADLPWYQAKAAAAFFATPPSSTYQEALAHFDGAESIEPGFYAKNKLMLGKTNLRLKNSAKAKQYLEECLAMPANNADDRAAHAEAKQLLAQC
eukprot:m.241077 g.241077  ORF g.241077 m.241077 type:complete len:327 (-) comp13780_c0_seq1:31-1011(-)